MGMRSFYICLLVVHAHNGAILLVIIVYLDRSIKIYFFRFDIKFLLASGINKILNRGGWDRRELRDTHQF